MLYSYDTWHYITESHDGTFRDEREDIGGEPATTMDEVASANDTAGSTDAAVMYRKPIRMRFGRKIERSKERPRP